MIFRAIRLLAATVSSSDAIIRCCLFLLQLKKQLSAWESSTGGGGTLPTISYLDVLQQYCEGV
jgi:hypothetical protein